jgi:two-component system response regulator YesN
MRFLQVVFDDIFDRMDRMLGDMELEPGAYERKVVSTVKKIIEQTYNREIELSELANHVYLTANYVSFLFRKETGMTITEYIIDLRVSKAKELLLNQLELKTYEVGQAVGYPDAAYFNRLFKKVVGTTPRMYREQTQITQLPN